MRGFGIIPIVIIVALTLGAMGAGVYIATSPQSDYFGKLTVPEGADSQPLDDTAGSVEKKSATETTEASVGSPSVQKQAVSHKPGASIRVLTVLTQSLNAAYTGFPEQVEIEIYSTDGTRYDSGEYSRWYNNERPDGNFTAYFDECAPPGTYYLRATELVPREVPTPGIPYSVQGGVLSESASFSYQGAPKYALCKEQESFQKDIPNTGITISPATLVSPQGIMYVGGTASVPAVIVIATDKSGNIVYQGKPVTVKNGRWIDMVQKEVPVGTYNITVSGGGISANATYTVEPNPPTCTVKPDKEKYIYQEPITFSWTTTDADYVAVILSASSPHGKFPVEKLPAHGSATVTYDWNGAVETIALGAYSKYGEARCATHPEVDYTKYFYPPPAQ